MTPNSTRATTLEAKRVLLQASETLLADIDNFHLEEVTPNPGPDTILYTHDEATIIYRLVAFMDKDWERTADLTDKVDKRGHKRAWRKPSATILGPKIKGGIGNVWDNKRKARVALTHLMDDDTDHNVTVQRVFGPHFPGQKVDFAWFVEHMNDDLVVKIRKGKIGKAHVQSHPSQPAAL